MAEQNNNQEKTEQATPKRRQEAREKGQVARSQEVASVAILGSCLVYFYFNAGGLVRGIGDLMAAAFRESAQITMTPASIQVLLAGYLYKVFLLLSPFLLTVFIAGAVANILQVGILFSGEPLQPKLSKIDPMKGFQRLFSLKSLVELFKSILKMCTVGFVAWVAVKGEIKYFPQLVEQGAGEIIVYMGRMSFKILLMTCLVMVVVAILDYVYQRWEYEKGLKMSRQEIKEEYRHTEGDPLVKARIKRVQREMAKKRMMANVPKADVVITNPTHIAVALKYDQQMPAPIVLAKGAGHVAETIKSLAKANGIPVVENREVAQVLYKMVDISGIIPENLYRAVAEILAYVYQLKGKTYS